MRCPSEAPMAPPMAAPTTAPVRALPPTWLPMIAPTTAPAAAPMPAPRFAFAFGSSGSVDAQAAAKRVARRRTVALRTMGRVYGIRGRDAGRDGRTESVRVRADVDLDAAVELPAVRGAVRRARLGLAVADGVDARAFHAEGLEVVGHRAGPAIGETLVVRVRADRVGVSGDLDRRARVLLEHVGHLAERRARRGAERARVEVEEDLVAHGNVQLVRSSTRDADALDLPELALLLVHHRADDRAGGAACEHADRRAALGAVVAAVVSDDGAGNRAGDAADRGTLLCLLVVVDLGERGAGDEQHGQERCDLLFHIQPPGFVVLYRNGPATTQINMAVRHPLHSRGVCFTSDAR